MQRGHVVIGVWWTACALVALGCGGPPVAPAPQKGGDGKALAPPQASPSQIAPGSAAPTAPSATAGLAAPSAARGAELYGKMCAVCHGANGEGYLADQAPALAQQDFLASVSDTFLAVAIADGRTGTQMSAWGAERGGPLAAADVQAIVAFLRSWQRQASLVLDESPARGVASRGARIFARDCAQCHGPKAPTLRLTNPELLTHASRGFLRHAIRKGRPPTLMQAYEQQLGDQGVEDVVAWLEALPKVVPHAPAVPGLPPPIPLGKLPLNRRGPEPIGFEAFPNYTSVAVVAREYKRRAKMVLLDARPPSDYAKEHIAGASSVPFYDPAPYIDKLPKNAWLVCYCGCPHAESGALAQKLMGAGFEQVTVLDEGLWEWKAKGHPMREGVKP